MGTYLYGIRKLQKAKQFTREDGQTVTVTHELKYRHKPWQHMNFDPTEGRIVGQLKHNYPLGFKGYVLWDDMILAWDGPAYWYDCDDSAPTWGVIHGDTVELPPARFGSTKFPTVLFDTYFGKTKTTTVRGVQMPDGSVEFRGSPTGTHRVSGDAERILAHWAGYRETAFQKAKEA